MYTSHLQTMRLLLVEDEEKLARLVKRGLVAERFSVDGNRGNPGGGGAGGGCQC